jgi:predicted nucleotidyltransferase component of viral defense system
MIRPGEISKMARQLGLSERTIERDYVLTWVLFAIGGSPLREHLAFKGGTAIRKMYVPHYRFSEDLDFTLTDGRLTNEALLAVFESLFPWLRREVNIPVAVRKLEVHASGNPTVFLNYAGPLQGDIASRFIKVDFTRDEALAFPLRHEPIRAAYSDCEGRTIPLAAYALEEILAEKLRSLLTRTEPRDLYDVHYLLSNQLADAEQVAYHLSAKFGLKGLNVSDLQTVLDRKARAFKPLWRRRLDGQVPEIPPLEAIIRETKRMISEILRSC